MEINWMIRMSDEIYKKVQEHEKRLAQIEKYIFSKDVTKIKPTHNNFKGLAGGIRFLIHNGFFNKLVSVKEITEKLKREGYHHSTAPISKMLSINFTKNQKILNRIKEDGVWKYVLRK